MSAPASNPAPRPVGDDATAKLPFAELLAALRARGFEIGVDHWLRLIRVLDGVEGSVGPDGLAELLAPVLATDPDEQRTVHRLVRDLYGWGSPAGPAAEPPSTTSAGRRRRRRPESSPSTGRGRRTGRGTNRGRRKILLGLTAALLVALGLFVVLRPAPPPAPDLSTAPPSEEARRDAARDLGDTVEDFVRDPFRIPGEGLPPEKIDRPTPRPPTPPESREASPFASLFRWLLVGFPVAAVILLELLRRSRDRSIRKSAATTRPPLVWTVPLPEGLPSPFGAEELRVAARALRRRAAGSDRVLDLGASIRATIARAGRVVLVDRPRTRVPEYLILVDKRSPNDHRAAYDRELARALAAEDVFLQIFSFDRDPRICRDASGRTRSLAELADRFGGHRLLLFSDGSGLIEPWTGDPTPAGDLLRHWSERAIASHVPETQHGVRETLLAERFDLVPASLDGLQSLGERFDTGRPSPVPLRDHPALPADLREPTPEVLAELRRTLGDEAFRWLCACAVHSTLQWELTLHLAALPGLGTAPLRDESLRRLVGLHWMIEGEIPPAWRRALLEELPDEVEANVRRELARLLDHTSPPAGSVAAASWELQVAIQDAWLARSEGRDPSRPLARVLEFPESRWRRDGAALRLLESLGPRPLGGVVPPGLRPILYRSGLPVRGWRALPRLLVAAAIGIGLAFLTAPEDDRTDERVRIAESRPEEPDLRPEARPTDEPVEPVTPERGNDADSSPDTGPEEPEEPEDAEGAPESESPTGSTEVPPPENPADSIETSPEASPETPRRAPPRTSSSPPPGDPPSTGGPTSRPDDAPPGPSPPRAVDSRDDVPLTSSESATRNPADDATSRDPEPPPEPPATAPTTSNDTASAESSPSRPAAIPDEPTVRVEDGGVTVVAPIRFEEQRREVVLPIDRWVEPVYHPQVLVEVGSTWTGRERLRAEAGFWNAASAGHVGTLAVALLDASGGVILEQSRDKNLEEGGEALAVDIDLDGPTREALSGVRIRMQTVNDPSRLRRTFRRWIEGEPEEEPPTIEPKRLSVDGRNAAFELPLESEVRIDAFARPILVESAATQLTDRRIRVVLSFANPSTRDERVEVTASVVDRDGEILAAQTEQGWVEEGQFGREIDLSFRRTKDGLDRAAAVRIDLTSSPD